MDHHFEIRCDERLLPDERKVCIDVAQTFANTHPNESHAVHIASLKNLRGPYWGEESNGSRIVAIIREGVITTIMLRRKTQPFTKEALKVAHTWKVRIS